MRVSGFTFVRNAVRLDYPVVESIRSVLPMVDEFVVNVGLSDDHTAELVGAINDPKLRIVHSHWNPNVSSGGYVLAQQTNIALFNCTGDWAVYVQADEAIHERDHAGLIELMKKYQSDDRIEGLALRRLSFYGDYQTLFDMHPWHLELVCRVVKPHRFVLSRGDALGFTVHPKYKERGQRVRVVDTGLDIFHYMDVRTPTTSQDYLREKEHFWNLPDLEVDDSKAYYYRRFPKSFLARFNGVHPITMHERIRNHPPLDEMSALWREKMTPAEWRIHLRTQLTRILGVRFSPGRASRKVVTSYRVNGHPEIAELMRAP